MEAIALEKSPSLTHKIVVPGTKEMVYINIRLNDECKNGHQDFAITGEIYEAGKPKTDRYFISGGCIHDRILKVRPKLKQFVDLHLCDYNGAPMYAIGNGFYHLKKDPLIGKEYLRLTEAEFQILKDCEDELELSVLIHTMGISERWKQEAAAAIKQLEEWTGQEFLNNSVKAQYTPPTPEQIADYKHKKESGYYTSEQKQQREAQRKEDKKNKRIKAATEKRDKVVNEANADYMVDIAVIEAGLSDNYIYYNHSNELVFNWLDYKDPVTEEQFNSFVSSVDRTKLPEGITFKPKGKK